MAVFVNLNIRRGNGYVSSISLSPPVPALKMKPRKAKGSPVIMSGPVVMPVTSDTPRAPLPTVCENRSVKKEMHRSQMWHLTKPLAR